MNGMKSRNIAKENGQAEIIDKIINKNSYYYLQIPFSML